MSDISQDIIEDAKKIVDDLILQEYGPYIEVIQKNIGDNLQEEFHELHKYTIYCTDGLYHANRLSNELAKITKFVEMQTNVPYRKFTIFANGYPICTVFSMGFFRNDKVIDIIRNKNNNFIPKELELIQAYHKLYDITKHDEWDELKCDAIECLECVIGGNRIYFDGLLIGYHALNRLGLSHEKGRLQIISGNVDQSISQAKLMWPNAEIKKVDLALPHDFRLEKRTVYVNKKPVMDIFNSAEYELVPYIGRPKVNMIAHHYVICRFLLIDYWISVLFNTKRKNLLHLVKKICESAGPPSQFYGVHIDERFALKKLHQDSAFTSYVPYKHYQKNNSFRDIKETLKKIH